MTVGFTSGIAVIIFASQLRDLLGITLAGKEPGELIPKLEALGGAVGTVNSVRHRHRGRDDRHHLGAPEDSGRHGQAC